MCGRFVSVFTTEDLLAVAEELGGLSGGDTDVESADWNVAPSRAVPLFAADGEGVSLVSATWGIVPAWKRDAAASRPLINARSETAAEKSTFRKAAVSGRCIVPMTGYYEWKTDPHSRKIPYFIGAVDGSPLLAGGLLDESRTGFVILTRQAPESVSTIHDRSPFLMAGADADEWLHSPEWPDPAAWLGRIPDLSARRVNREVNSFRNNGPRMLDSPDEGLFGA